MISDVVASSNSRIINIVGEFNPESYDVIPLSIFLDRVLTSESVDRLKYALTEGNVCILPQDSYKSFHLNDILKNLTNGDPIYKKMHDLRSQPSFATIYANAPIVLFTPTTDWYTNLPVAFQRRIFLSR